MIRTLAATAFIAILTACGGNEAGDGSSADGQPAEAPKRTGPAPEPVTVEGITLDPLGCESATPKAGKGEQGVEQWCEAGGVMHGPYVLYSYEGKRIKEGSFQDGVQNGSWTWYHPDGRSIKTKGRYTKGKQVGSWTQWHDNGERAEEGDYLEGRRSGLWLTWHPNGLKASEGIYQNGRQNGTWTFWTEEGELEKQELWQHGELLETATAEDIKKRGG